MITSLPLAQEALARCRLGYQNAKIAHNEGQITADQLEDIRLRMEAVEKAFEEAVEIIKRMGGG